MSLHPSFKRNKEKHRSVRKRYERFRSLRLQNKFDKEKDSIYNLPKERNIQFKIKKEKKEEKVEVSTLTFDESKKVKKQSRDIGKIK
jgi:small basic protein (TIGR04137 family)